MPINSLAQKNKATSYHLGQLKAKLAKLRRELINGPSGGGGGGGGIGFDVARYAASRVDIISPCCSSIDRTGIASVGFVGFPSVGKVSNRRAVIVCRLLIFRLVDIDVQTHRDPFRNIRN